MKKILTILLAIGIMLNCATTSVFAENNQLDRIENNTNNILLGLGNLKGMRNNFNVLSVDGLNLYYYLYYEYLDFNIDFALACQSGCTIYYNLVNSTNFIQGKPWGSWNSDTNSFTNNNWNQAVSNTSATELLIVNSLDDTDLNVKNYKVTPYKLTIENNIINGSLTNNNVEPYLSTNIYYTGRNVKWNIDNPSDNEYLWYLDKQLVATGTTYTYIQDLSEHTLTVYERAPGASLDYDDSIINSSVDESILPGELIGTSVTQSIYSKDLEYLRSNSLSSHKAYAPDLADVYNALGTNFTPEQASKYFFDSDTPVDKVVWLRSGVDSMPDCGLCVNCLTGEVEIRPLPSSPVEVKPVFKIDLTQVDFEVN